MCLTVHLDSNEEPKARIATEDITVFKFAYKRGSILSAPYMVTDYEGIGVLMESELSWWRSYNRDGSNSPTVEIERGFHSFLRYQDALSKQKQLPASVVIKCRVPKGAKYYSGMFGERQSIASSQLIIDEIIPTV